MYTSNFNGLGMTLGNLSRLSDAQTRSISAENFTGEKGKGGMAVEGTGETCARELGVGFKVSPSICIKPKELRVIADIEGPGAIQQMWMTPIGAYRFSIIRIYWDGNENPSVECPMGDFFANAYDDGQYSPIVSIPVCINPVRGFNCYWEMPFKKHCKITVENIAEEDVVLYYQINYTLTKIPDDCAYFHAQFRRTNPLPYKQDYTIVDGIKGKGHYIGTYMFWGVNNNGWWGEGEIKFFMDGDEYPTICGTGTEDYFCGAYNFDVNGRYMPFSSPYSGMPKVIAPDGLYNSQQRFSLYRWHIMDPIRFENDLKVTIQALGWRSGGRYLPLQDDISSVAFWYQENPCQKFPNLPSKDELEIT